MNSFGNIFRVTVLGESHGYGVGAVVDGCPPGIDISPEEIQKDLDRRKPGASDISTPRKESDTVEILSGVMNGKTTGAPILMIIRNEDTDSSKYDKLRTVPRPGHADLTSFIKYWGFGDHRGGGRFSGRCTAALVMAGAIAKKINAQAGVEVLAHTVSIGKVSLCGNITMDQIKNRYSNDIRCADPALVDAMREEIKDAGEHKDSVGGMVECLSLGAPAGLGEPFFDSLEGELAKMMFAIPAVKGVEFGSGFGAAYMLGSENNDGFIVEGERIATETNNAGGVLGGISNGMPVAFKVAVKPTSSIGKPQRSVNLETMQEEELVVEGRHDPCIVPRAVPVIEAGTAIVFADMLARAGAWHRWMKKE